MKKLPRQRGLAGRFCRGRIFLDASMRQSGVLPISDSPPFVIRFALRMCVRLPSEANNRKIETFDLNLSNFSYCRDQPALYRENDRF